VHFNLQREYSFRFPIALLKFFQLQNPQLVTSYALPPSALFTAAPYSIYRKGTSKTPSQRFTYASVTEATPGAKSQIVCFHEKTLGDNAETVKTSYTPSNGAQVSSFESLPVTASGSAKSATHDVLATFDNGDVVCLSADLEVVRWVANLNAVGSQSGAQLEIESVSLATAKAVTRGLLRSREDIAAILNPSLDESSDILELTQIICIVGQKSTGSRMLRLLQVQSRSADLPTTSATPLKHLLSWDLPAPSNIVLRTHPFSIYSLHAASGALHILVDGGIISYDLSGTVPKVHSELVLPEAKIDSFLRVSQDVILTTSQGSCRAFDVKYNSLQALLPLDSTSSGAGTSPKKRKHAQPESDEQALGTPKLVAHYADIGLVVAIRENEVCGMQFGGSNTRKRVKTEGTLLVDALGKGIASSLKAAESQKWQDRKAKLDRYASKGKIAKFEEVFAAALNIPLDTTDVEAKRENEEEGGPLTNGGGPKIPDEDAMAIEKVEEESEDQLRKWILPQVIPDSQRQQYRQHALFALRKIFRWEEVDTVQRRSRSPLRVEFFPPNVFQWLLQIGHITKESIRRALLDDAPKLAHSVPQMTDGDVVNALVEFDPELHILSAVLNHSHFLPIGEVVQAIKLLIQSLDDKPKASDTTKLLTNGAAPSENDMDVDIATEIEAASHEIDHALSVLDQGVLIRSNTLRPALVRLHTFPPPMISSTLRSLLSRRDLESLIRLLHLELKNGGWTSPYDFIDPEASTVEPANDSPDDHAVTIIASLLSNSLDAIGAGAWLAAVGKTAEHESSQDIIESLHSDTSEALNGFWEARYMRGLLSEFLRYASNVPKSQKPSNKSLENQGKPFAADTKADELPMLPLGAKVDFGIEKTKQGRGGKREERSKREIGMLISKKVPKYSFERIVV
jgi:hypothetical protein